MSHRLTRTNTDISSADWAEEIVSSLRENIPRRGTVKSLIGQSSAVVYLSTTDK